MHDISDTLTLPLHGKNDIWIPQQRHLKNKRRGARHCFTKTSEWANFQRTLYQCQRVALSSCANQPLHCLFCDQSKRYQSELKDKVSQKDATINLRLGSTTRKHHQQHGNSSKAFMTLCQKNHPKNTITQHRTKQKRPPTPYQYHQIISHNNKTPHE